jgi:hypothetical protein
MQALLFVPAHVRRPSGIITEVTFQLTDSTNTQISTRIQVSDANLASDLNDELISKVSARTTPPPTSAGPLHCMSRQGSLLLCLLSV